MLTQPYSLYYTNKHRTLALHTADQTPQNLTGDITHKKTQFNWSNQTQNVPKRKHVSVSYLVIVARFNSYRNLTLEEKVNRVNTNCTTENYISFWSITVGVNRIAWNRTKVSKLDSTSLTSLFWIVKLKQISQMCWTLTSGHGSTWQSLIEQWSSLGQNGHGRFRFTWREKIHWVSVLKILLSWITQQ